MHQSRIYAIVYVFIALPKGTFWWPTVLTLWYHHISIYRLCHNASLVCLTLTNTPQLQCNVMVPSHHSVLVTPWFPCILLWYGSFSHIRHILPGYGTITSIHLVYAIMVLWYGPVSPICPMYVISLSSITCVLPASSSIYPSVSRIFP